MTLLPIRLTPGQDLRRALEDAVAAQGVTAAFVLSGIGSLAGARLRLADAADAEPVATPCEILTLSGTIAGHTSHLHASLSDARGSVVGGHVGTGCIVRTTAEVLLVLLPDWDFSRVPDAATGYDELALQRRAGPRTGG